MHGENLKFILSQFILRKQQHFQ